VTGHATPARARLPLIAVFRLSLRRFSALICELDYIAIGLFAQGPAHRALQEEDDNRS
jgi:hypothetical protein